MCYDVGEVTQKVGEWALLWLTMSSAHSPTFPSRHLHHSSFFQPFRRFSYVTAHSPILPLLHLRHSSFSNHSFASPTSQALHLTLPRAAHAWVQIPLTNIFSSKNIYYIIPTSFSVLWPKLCEFILTLQTDVHSRVRRFWLFSSTSGQAFIIWKLIRY